LQKMLRRDMSRVLRTMSPLPAASGDSSRPVPRARAHG
jgi:hypothetical protein